MKQIVVATDGSPGSELAVTRAIELAAGLGATLTFVSVVPETGFSANPVSGAPEAATATGGRAAVRAAVQRATEAGVQAEFEYLEGDAADAIVAAAQQRQADIIVVGSRGLGALRSLVLGSVSREVVDRADRPVLIVK
jgi:nucleotide-binding universal stress UspA family protein